MTEWINIKDKLPKKDGRYLVYIPNYKWIGVSSLRNGKWDDNALTHWMPLPEAPK